MDFSFSSTSSSPQYKNQLPSLGNSRRETHRVHDGDQRTSLDWLGNRYDPEDDKEETLTAATASEAKSTGMDSDSTLELRSSVIYSKAIKR